MILDNDKILRTCNRLAYEIIEQNEKSNEVFIIGIKEKGFEIAKIIKKNIVSISNKKVKLYPISVSKNGENSSINFDKALPKNLRIFLIDDVLNTGNTLFKCVNYLFTQNCHNIKTIVLIDRDHKKYPVNVDIKGVSLSTNFEDTVKVISANKKLKAVLV